jgi:hypothetical protein
MRIKKFLPQDLMLVELKKTARGCRRDFALQIAQIFPKSE